LDYTLGSASIEENGTGFLLERDKIFWYFDNYFQKGEDRRQASPLFQKFTNKLPETLVITAQFCPLRDEGARYVEKMTSSTTVNAEQLHFDDMIHAFLNLEDLARESCDHAYRAIGQFLNR
jgi:acetyl esterase/lipase